VNSDNQTLILAGEAIPRRDLASLSANARGPIHGGPPLTIKTLTADQYSLLRSSASSSRGSSFNAAKFNAANEYARTQDLSNDGMRTAIIDTYA
jgi:hypothetical protein